MTATTYAIDPTGVSAGLLVGRLMLGLAMAAHGSQKLFGWFGGYGLGATGGFFEQLGFRPGRAYAAAAAGGRSRADCWWPWGCSGRWGRRSCSR